jgi:haloalkane dehalogenase
MQGPKAAPSVRLNDGLAQRQGVATSAGSQPDFQPSTGVPAGNIEDSIGMGRSGKPDIATASPTTPATSTPGSTPSTWTRVVLIGHDRGGALAFDWAARHPQRVLGIAFLESIVKPMAWQELSPQAREHAEVIRTPGTGEQLVLDQNLFVRTAFTAAYSPR